MAFFLAALYLGAATGADRRFDTGRTGSSGGSENKRNAQMKPESVSVALLDDAEVMKVAADQEKLGHWYEARRTLARAAGTSQPRVAPAACGR